MSIPAQKFFIRAIFLTIALIMMSVPVNATFSIVAVDTLTGEVGGAGASCINGSQIINDLIESVGGVHTQAWYLEGNQDNAHALLAAGIDPDSIISWLANNDIEGQPELRQYGVVTLAGPGASAGYTGWGTDDWKGHITGPGYAIQGNILLGPEIIQDMETAYLNTDGSLEVKLMAALQAANVPGADTRCLGDNKPALSAFIHVIRPGDGSSHYLNIVVSSSPSNINPIDRVQELFDVWQAPQFADAALSEATVSPEAILADGSSQATITVVPKNLNGDFPTDGITDITITNRGDGTLGTLVDNGDGTYEMSITAPTAFGADTIDVAITAAGETVPLDDKPALRYFLCGDGNGDLIVNIGDAVWLINYVFKGGAAPDPVAMGDANCDGLTNVGDAVYVINFVFSSGPPPCAGCP